MNDFTLSGAAPLPPAAPPLSHLTIAFALLFYFAVAVLVFGLALQTLRMVWLNRAAVAAATRQGGGLRGRARQAFRAGTDVLLLRSTFFSDRWAWIFGAAFYFGLALVLLRHVRYWIEPGWIGPLWKGIILVQPFGYYAGMALPIGAGAWWIRQVVLRKGRILTGWADHAVMALLVAIPISGYVNEYFHTDIIAVKDFWIGLLTFHWKPLPADPYLLVHLWLVAVLLVVLPFSRILLLAPLGHLLRIPSTNSPAGRKLVHGFGPMVAVLLLIPIAITLRHAVTKGFHPQSVDMATLVDEHRSDDSSVMISNHPRFLFTYRTTVVYHGKWTQEDNLERCVACHVVKDAKGQPVSFSNPKHFCRSCHYRAAVSIDCFECHRSTPPAGPPAWIDAPTIASTLASNQGTASQ